jgi:hypothetical protein
MITATTPDTSTDATDQQGGIKTHELPLDLAR